MKKLINLIKSTTLFKYLTLDQIEESLKNGKFKVVTYKQNSVIHFDGELCNKLEIILSGKVVVDRIDESGNLFTIVEFCKDDILGGNLLFSTSPFYPMTVSTQELSQILEIENELLFELLSSNKDLLRTYLEYISDHASILGNKIKHYANKTIRESLMAYLEYESKIQNSNQIKLEITKKELAERIGVQRTSLSRELAKMRNEGLVTFDSNSITILKN
ncbi:MAG: Crp/Fnr family transcriptional regulator [Clostridiales bacterium]|nr:Crp/Fnr family transcriptional regulator [Clostridiales bacterium]